jgi:hypothetical protein
MNCIEVETLDIEYLPLPFSTDRYTTSSLTPGISIIECPNKNSIDSESSSTISFKANAFKLKLKRFIKKLKN